MNLFLRFGVLILLAIGVLFGGYATGWYAKFNIYDSWKVKQLKKQEKQFWQKLLEESLKDDIYGSKNSPEETFQMFIEAVEKEDFELASKYFWPESQENWRKKLIELKQNNELEKNLNKWKNIPNIWKKEKKGPSLTGGENFKEAVFSFTDFRDKSIKEKDPILGQEFIIPAGEFKNRITFEFNPVTKVWKISSF